MLLVMHLSDSGITYSQSTKKAGLYLTLTNIKNNKGLIRIGMFRSEEGYPDKPFYKFSFEKDSIKNGVLRAFIPLEKNGPVSLSILDDENRNEKMDYILGIMPKEGFGFSNNPKINLKGAPPFSATAVDFTGGIKEIAVRMTYMR